MKIFCVGRNYVAHATELGNEVPEEPVIFMKPKSALVQGNAPFYYPEFTNELHYEGELVVRICRNGKWVQERQAHMYYNAATIGIDFTARDIQRNLKEKGLPWEKAKAFDGSAAIGKMVDLKPGANGQFSFTLQKNGIEVQNGNTKDMIYSINQIVSHISQYFSLNIGDLVFTGTPAGVGECVVGDSFTGTLNNEKLLELSIG